MRFVGKQAHIFFIPANLCYLCITITKNDDNMKKLIWIIACLCVIFSASAQQRGIVRTLERPGKPSQGIEGVTVNVLEYPNSIVSKKGGKFSFEIAGKRQGDSFTLARVQKKGYTLVDKQMKGRSFAYSSTVPLEIVMVADQQLENDKKRIEDKAYSRAKKDYDQKVAILEKQLKEKTISEQEYRKKCEALNADYNNYIQLIDQMAERYATTDYKGLSDINRQTLECIENADLERADSLINSKGDFDKREQELNDKMALKEKSDKLSQQLEKDIQIEAQDLIQDYYNKYTIHAANYRNDSAAYYLERIVRIYYNTDILKDVAWFIDNYLADYGKALEYYQQALACAQEEYGEESEKTGEITEWIALTYDHLGNADQSLEWHSKAIDIYEQTIGIENPGAALVYTHIGRIYIQKGELEKALEYTMKGLEIRERTIADKDDQYFSQSYNNLGVIYNDMGEYDKAMEYHKKALEMRERLLGPDNDATALSYLNIGSSFYKTSQNDSALVYYQKALEVYQHMFGPYHPNTLIALTYISSLMNEMGNYDQALEYGQQALSCSEHHYGPESNQTASCLNDIAEIYTKVGDTAKAKEYYMRIIDIYEKNGAITNEQAQQARESIQNIKLQ